MLTIPTITCPSDDELTAFHFGTLSVPDLDAVGDHLETCPQCQKRIQGLDDLRDPMLCVLGGSATAEALEPTVPAGPPAATLRLDWLGPARGPEEIGWLGPHFCVRRVLGRGGMGIVFAAEDTRLGRLVALKVLRPELAAKPEARQRFLREARVMAALPANPYLVPIYDVDEANGVPFLAMELLDGEALDRRLARGPRPTPAEIIRVGRQIAAGLAVAHARGLVHRDIKPANLWVQPPGDTIKILDFGLARAVEEDLRMTSTGVIAGTPAYLSPEQIQDQPIDARTDLFNLGCVLYELCAGQPPFRGRTTFALLNAAVTSVPVPVRNLRPDVPPALADLIMNLLAKRPADRPPSAEAVARRLDAIARAPEGRRGSRWHRIALMAAALAAIVIGAAVLQVRTSKGLVEIRTDDPKIRVTVEQDGELITILDPVSKQQVELRAGEYQVKLLPDGAGLALNTDHFTLRRDGKEVLTVRRLDDIPRGADAAWVREVGALKAEEQVTAVVERLHKLNPKLTAPVQHSVEDGVVRKLSISGEQIRDISPVRALTGLRELRCAGQSQSTALLKDISALKGMKLTVLDCGGTGVADLAPLAGMPLKAVNCNGCPVADLTPLRDAPLEFLWISDTEVSSLAPLAGRPLRVLRCGKTAVADLTPLTGMKLVWLMCDYTKVKDLTPLKGMPLDYLNCGVTQACDLTPLQGAPLTFVNLGGTPVRDLSPLNGMKLKTLWVNQTAVADLTPLKGMKLKTLWVNQTAVADLTPLKGMALRDISLDIHGEADLKILRTMTSLQTLNWQPAAEFWRKQNVK